MLLRWHCSNFSLRSGVELARARQFSTMLAGFTQLVGEQEAGRETPMINPFFVTLWMRACHTSIGKRSSAVQPRKSSHESSRLD
jgi:hypothetical protein